jgi:hypothetical protein
MSRDPGPAGIRGYFLYWTEPRAAPAERLPAWARRPLGTRTISSAEN